MSCRWQNFLIEKDQSFEILYTSGNKPSSAAEASGEFFFFFFLIISEPCFRPGDPVELENRADGSL